MSIRKNYLLTKGDDQETIIEGVSLQGLGLEIQTFAEDNGLNIHEVEVYELGQLLSVKVNVTVEVKDA